MQTVLKKIFTVTVLAAVLILPTGLRAQNSDGSAPDPNQQQAPPPTNDQSVPAPDQSQDQGAPAPDPNAAPAPITLQTFYDQLAPYGQWVNYGAFGYVFIPSVAPGFEPYSTNGHWVYNDQYGWTWASDYAWGWATFHYGRWNYDNNYGWFWVPDLNWGPAWVAWRNCEGYYGWAPLPYGVNVNVGFAGDYGITPEHWCFVPQAHLCELNLGLFFVARTHNFAFIQHSVIINRMDYDNGRHFGYFKGPDRVEVEGYTHHPVVVVAIGQYRRPPVQRVVVVQNHGNVVGHRNVVVAPRQQVQRHDPAPARRQAAPARFVQAHDVPSRGNPPARSGGNSSPARGGGRR